MGDFTPGAKNCQESQVEWNWKGYPLAGLLCLSQKRRQEMAARLGRTS